MSTRRKEKIHIRSGEIRSVERERVVVERRLVMEEGSLCSLCNAIVNGIVGYSCCTK
jgi:hypothetical protein